MATIYTRAGKGSALTWTEGDANITNLNNELITKVASVSAGTGISVTGTTTPSVALANTAVSAGSYTIGSFTVDAQGRLTAASSASTTGSGNVVLATSPTLVTPILGTPTSGTLTNCTGLPISSGVSGLGTNVATALAVTVGSSGAIVTNGGALGTPSSGTVTNLTGTASININGTVGATTPNTGAFTTLSASSTVSGTGFSTYLASPPAIGGTTAAAVSATTLTFKDPREAIFDLGTTGGTIAPNVANGSVQKITLNSALTINAFTSPVAGQSLTLIIFGGTAYTSISSTTLKFAGGATGKTLTATAGCIDILSVYYDGTNYYASLNKGFA